MLELLKYNVENLKLNVRINSKPLFDLFKGIRIWKRGYQKNIDDLERRMIRWSNQLDEDLLKISGSLHTFINDYLFYELCEIGIYDRVLRESINSYHSYFMRRKSFPDYDKAKVRVESIRDIIRKEIKRRKSVGSY